MDEGHAGPHRHRDPAGRGRAGGVGRALPEQDPGTAAVGLLAAADARSVAEAHGVPAPLARLNVFRLLLRQPALAAGVSALLLALLAGEGLDPRLRELAIMRVAWGRRSVYEWTQHWTIATAMGVPAADLLAVRDDPGSLGPVEQVVVRAADEVTGQGRVSPATVAELRGHLPETGVLELVAVVGAWSMVAVLLDSLTVPLEDGVEPWPPDGRSPG